MGKKVKKETEAPPSDVFDPVAIESKNAKTAVIMLDSPEQEVLLKACESLYRFGEKSEENRVQLMNFGALEPLFNLVKSDDKAVHRNAMMAFGVMSCHPDVKRAMRNMDCTKVIMKLLDAETEEPITTEFASLYFASMAVEFTHKVELLERGVMEPLIPLLSATDPDVVKNALEAVNLLLHDYQSRASVRQFEGIAPMLELTKSEYPVIQQLALESLAKVTQDVENRDAMRELEALDLLIKFLNKPEWQDQHVNALLVLSNLLLDAETVGLLAEGGGLKKLYEVLVGEEPRPAEVKVHACIAIARSAKNEDNRRILHEQEMEKVLIQLLTESGEEAQVRAAAAKALSQMAESVTCKNFIGRNDAIGPLLSQIKSNNDDLRESASLCLANLTAGNQYNCNEVYEKNGMDPLINLLSDPREACQANAATALTNMATDEVIRSSLQALVVVGALAAPLQSNSNIVQARAAMALASFCYDADARRELRDSGGAIPALVGLIGSGSDEVRRNACWAVAVAAADTETTAEFCTHGVIHQLNQVNESTTRRSNYSELAQERIFDNHLPAKYSYFGKLSVNNILTNEPFYDPGALTVHSRFPTLEEVHAQEVDDRREVVLVNIQQESAHRPDVTSEGGSLTDESGTPPAGLAAAPPPPASTGQKKKPPVSSSTAMKNTSEKARERARNLRQQKDKKEEEGEKEKEEGEGEKAAFVPPEDHNLDMMIKCVRSEILPLPTTEAQIAALAQFVSDKMGGRVSREELMHAPFKLAIHKLKKDLGTNVIPIGLIKQGTFYHRALLFKALADKIALPCTLERGQYNRAWNVVAVHEKPAPGGPAFPPKHFLVDLMHEPGALYEVQSQKAVAYQRL